MNSKSTLTKIKSTNWKLVLGLFSIALFICLVSPLSPISRDTPDADSSVFLTIAKGMTEGKLPYRDFFDHKGPLLYLINYIGWILGKSRGVWLMELASMTTAVLFSYKTARLQFDSVASFLGVLFTFVMLLPFAMYPNGVEGYALPFISIGLYIFAKYFLQGQVLQPLLIAASGACFGCTLMLRPNMFAMWVAFCLVILVDFIRKKKFRILIIAIFSFLAGTLAVLVPFLLFQYSNGVLKEFIQAYLVFNGQYATSTLSIDTVYNNVIAVMESGFFPIVAALSLYLVVSNKNETRFFSLAIFLSLGLSAVIICLAGTAYAHYYCVLFPLFIPCIASLSQCFVGRFTHNNKDLLIGGVLCCIILCSPLSTWLAYVVVHASTDRLAIVREIADMVNNGTAEDETVTVLGNQCQFYLYIDRPSASKYIYQLPLADISSDIRDEYLNDFYARPPKIVIMQTIIRDEIFGSNEFYPYALSALKDTLQQDYTCISDYEHFMLLERKE